MELFNTLSRKAEEFKPQEDNLVTMYACGPTVYDSAHIGNLRTYIFEDVLKRTLEIAGYSVKHIMNLTDVDDKTIKKSEANKVKLANLTKRFEEEFISNIKKLNIELPNKFTRATSYIEQMATLIKSLLDKGIAYKASDGSIYFSINKFKNYGKLSNLDKEGIKAGARVNQDEYSKENPADFVLWKAWDKADGDIYWESLLGKGRPGWHIECSAMAQAELGETIDIHAGAVDLIFPHHENEIAQSEAATGKQFVRFWVHGEHLLVDGKKMAKSANNFYTLTDIEEKGFSPLDFRYLCLGAHYRSKLNFTWEGLIAAKNSRERLINIIGSICHSRPDRESTNSLLVDPRLHGDDKTKGYQDEFKERIFDDLDTPGAMAAMWEMMRDDATSDEEKLANIAEFDKVLGLNLLNIQETIIPVEIEELIKKRDQARANKDFAESDKIRTEIEAKGYRVEDTGSGTRAYLD